MKPKPVWGLVLIAALAPLAWAGPQTAQSQAAASSQSHARAHGNANLPGQQAEGAIQSGTRISARLLTSLNAKKAKPGQRVEAQVTQDVKQNGRVVIRKNSRLLGHVVSASAKGKGNANSQVQVVFDHLVQGNATTALNTVVTSIVSVPMAPMPEPMSMPSPPMASSPAPAGGGPAGGGVLGGVGGAVNSTVGGAVGAVGSTADNVGAMAGSTVGAAGQMGAGVAGSAASAANAITVTNSLGATGSGSAGISHRMANVNFNSSGHASNQTAATSTFSRRNGNVQLDSGTQMQFQVAGNASAGAPAGSGASTGSRSPSPRSH